MYSSESFKPSLINVKWKMRLIKQDSTTTIKKNDNKKIINGKLPESIAENISLSGNMIVLCDW